VQSRSTLNIIKNQHVGFHTHDASEGLSATERHVGNWPMRSTKYILNDKQGVCEMINKVYVK